MCFVLINMTRQRPVCTFRSAFFLFLMVKAQPRPEQTKRHQSESYFIHILLGLQN